MRVVLSGDRQVGGRFRFDRLSDGRSVQSSADVTVAERAITHLWLAERYSRCGQSRRQASLARPTTRWRVVRRLGAAATQTLASGNARKMSLSRS